MADFARALSQAEPFTVDHFESWGRTLILDTGDPWLVQPYQLEFYDDVFRGFREAWQVIPEGNGKTTGLAGLGLYALRFAEDASVPMAASTRDQMKTLYRQAKGLLYRSGMMVRGERPGDTWFEAFDGWRRIDLRGFNSRNKRGDVLGLMEVYAADAGSADGLIPFPYAFVEELHRHRSLELYELWRGKLEKRGAQLITISTAGAPGSDFEELREKIIREGEVKQRGRTFKRVEAPNFVLHEWAVPPTGDVTDFGLVAEANPKADITAATLEAKRATPTMTDAHWRRFTCNIPAEIDSDPFVVLADWVDLGRGYQLEPGAAVCLGADGSRTWDTTVVAWAGADEDGLVHVDARVFSVRPNVAHHVLHTGGKIDFEDVEEFILDRFEQYDVREAAYDPRYLERSMEIVDARLRDACVFPVEPNSKAMRDALQTLYRLVAEKRLRHRNDPVLAAHLANTTVDRGFSSEIRRVRKANQQKPIDAVPAMALAVWRASQAAAASVYEQAEVLTV